MTPNRKRSRDSDDEDIPLSKKAMHIHNGLLDQPTAVLVNAAWGGFQPSAAGQAPLLPDSPPSSVQSVEWNSTPALYNPELTEAQNPFYYNSNKLLYEMYVARLERSSQ